METELFRYWKPIQYRYKELCRIIDDKLTKLTYDDVDDFSVKELIEIITEILLPTFDEDSG